MSSYLALFASAFLAATVFPFYSEVILTSFLIDGLSPYWLWLAATLGNTLGAGVNWWLGGYCLHFSDRRWFPFKEKGLQRSQAWFQRYGKWSLLFAWMPVGGDALTFIAGTMRINLLTLLVLAGIGKGIRYLVVIWLVIWSSDLVVAGL